jgi:hypothetical protein
MHYREQLEAEDVFNRADLLGIPLILQGLGGSLDELPLLLHQIKAITGQA